MEIRAVRFEDARALTDAMVAEMTTLYGGGGASPADPRDFLPPYGVFLVAVLDGVQAACGGLRRLDPRTAEIKRMYADPVHRGRGLARGLLRGLLDHARAAEFEQVWLETGVRQPEAIGLYESEGFTAIEAYGHFRDDPLSRCFGLTL